jgi:hypothetical protein
MCTEPALKLTLKPSGGLDGKAYCVSQLFRQGIELAVLSEFLCMEGSSVGGKGLGAQELLYVSQSFSEIFSFPDVQCSSKRNTETVDLSTTFG